MSKYVFSWLKRQHHQTLITYDQVEVYGSIGFNTMCMNFVIILIV